MSTTQELNTALANVNVKKIVLNNNLTANFNATRKVDFDLNGKTLTGNVSYDTDAEGTILLSNGTVTGNLTVDTPNVSFTNSATVNGTTTITDVANNTFTNNGLLKGMVNLNDLNGARFVNNGTLDNGLNINTSAETKLEGSFAQVTISNNGKIILDGTIETLNAEQDVVIEGGSVEEVKGNGSVSLDAKTPEVEIKDNVTIKVSKTYEGKTYEFYGVQARILLTAEELQDVEEGDQVVVSLLEGEKVVATSTSKKELGDMFVNKFAGEEFYASTLFVPNAELGFYPSGSWNTTAWADAEKPTGLKVEIKRGEKVVYSVTSSIPLNENFVDADSTEPLTWEEILEFNKPLQQGE